MDPLIEDVADTALWVASYRARESERPDALFRDPLASRLAGDRGQDIARRMDGARQFAWSIVIRTCIIDRFIEEAIAGGVDTVLNLGAGLDTRPYRMSLPDTLRWVEVDQPKIIAHKEEHLRGEKAACQLTRHSADLAQADVRRDLFGQVNSDSQRVLVLTEGVVPYLAPEEAAALADDLRAQDHFRLWLADYTSPFLAAQMRRRRRHRQQLRNAPVRFMPDDWEGFFSAHGWKLREMRYTPEEGARLHRPLPLPLVFKLMYPFISEKRRALIQRMQGYGLLEPA